MMTGAPAPESSPNGLTRITVNLTRRAIALARLVAELGDGRSLRIVAADGSIERIHLI